MSLDFTALAGSLAVGVPGVRACLFVSGDGLALASHPASEEAAALAAWARLNELGLMERGFVAMKTENWVFSRRAEYSGLVITDPAVRPGVLLDRLEQALQLAEESRARHEGMSPVPGVVPMAAAAKEPSRPARRIRLPVHREAPRAVPEPELIEAERVPSRSVGRPAVPAPPVPPVEPLPGPPRREEPVAERPDDRADTPAPADDEKEEETARVDKKPAPRGRRGLGEYVGKQAKGGRGRHASRRSEPEETHDESSSRETRAEPPHAKRERKTPREELSARPAAREESATPPTAETAEAEAVEDLRDKPSRGHRQRAEQSPEPEPEDETSARPARSRSLDADLETLLSPKVKKEEPPQPKEAARPHGAMLDAVSAALEAPSLAAEAVAEELEPVVEAPQPEAIEAPEPEPVVAEATEAPEPEPVVAETPQPEAIEAPEPEPEAEIATQPVTEAAAVEAEPVPAMESAPPLTETPPVTQAPAAQAPEPVAVATIEPDPQSASIEEPNVPVDAVEEAKAAMWRRRMKAKHAKEDLEEEEKEAAAGKAEKASREAPPVDEVEKTKETPKDGEANSRGDVDVVALAREFSGLFGDEGREG